MEPSLQASRAAAEAWGIPVGEARAGASGKKFSWCKRFQMFFLTGPESRRGLVAVAPDGSTLRFANEKGAPADVNRAARLAAMNDLYQAEGVRLPSGLAPVELAASIRGLLVDPQGFVASRAFLEEQEKTKAIDMWTFVAPHLPGGADHTQAQRRELFVRACTDPVVEDQGRTWALKFSYFTPGGAVERWEVAGTAERVTSAREEVALPPNTFTSPYA